jgi:hypothetical protein
VRGNGRLEHIVFFTGVRVERERDGEGWLVLRGDQGWLHGDRRQAVRERDEIDDAERFPWGRGR